MKTILAPLASARAAILGAVGDGRTAARLLAPIGVAAATGAVLASAGASPVVAGVLALGVGAALGLIAAPRAPAAGRSVADRNLLASSPATTEQTPSEMVVRAFLDALAAPVLIVAASGRVMHANPAARASLPRLEEGAHHSSVIRAPEFVEAVARTFADGERRAVSFAVSPGRERLLEARLALLEPTIPFGPEPCAVVEIEDRTEVHRTEQLRSDFVANASHELRTPLASIIGFVETLQNHARDDEAARERFLAIMGREATRMQRLVDDLLSLSRIEMYQHVRPRTLCVVTDLAAEAAAALVPVAEAEGVVLEIALPPDGPEVPGDRDQLYQVFANLIDNAIKYGGKGARVRIDAAPLSRAFPNRLGVRISDTGPGIPREHLPRITERFYRANVGQSRHKGGTGLGLAIVKHILHRHEGKLEIVSEVGKGSAFTVWLPRAIEPTAEIALEPGDRAPAAAGRRG